MLPTYACYLIILRSDLIGAYLLLFPISAPCERLRQRKVKVVAE
jgi:hypothetical protein